MVRYFWEGVLGSMIAIFAYRWDVVRKSLISFFFSLRMISCRVAALLAGSSLRRMPLASPLLAWYPVAASFASSSTRLLAAMFSWPGIQRNLIFVLGCRAVIAVYVFCTSSRMYDPGCCHLRSCALRDGWLSTAMLTVPTSLTLRLILSSNSCSPSSCPTHSPSKTVCRVMGPRWYLAVLIGRMPSYITAAAPILSFCPDLSV